MCMYICIYTIVLLSKNGQLCCKRVELIAKLVNERIKTHNLNFSNKSCNLVLF